MKVKIAMLAILFTAFALTFSVATPAAPGTKAAVTRQPAAPAPAPAATPADHPEIRDALAALRRAKEHLQHAAHDYQGHRVEAIRATDEAIRQLEICLKYD